MSNHSNQQSASAASVSPVVEVFALACAFALVLLLVVFLAQGSASGSASMGVGVFEVALIVFGCVVLTFTVTRIVRKERRIADAARDELDHEREKLSSVVDCMADAVLYANTEGQILFHNKAAQGLWKGHSPKPSELRACHTPDAWALLLEKVSHPSALTSHPILRIGGRSYEATYAPVQGKEGALRGVVMVARDATDRLAGTELRSRQERLATVGKLAAGLAHELNNPLGTIELMVRHTLKRMSPTDPAQSHLATVLKNSEQCSRILRDLLDYSRQRSPARTWFELADWTDELERSIRAHADDRIVVRVIRCFLPPSDVDDAPVAIEPRAFGDPHQLRQVLFNLAVNAIEELRERGGEVTMEIRPLGDGGLLASVADNGEGVPADHQARMFSPFFTTKEHGTGLGLAVSNDIVQAHGGTLRYAERSGGGAMFTVTLPGPTSELKVLPENVAT